MAANSAAESCLSGRYERTADGELRDVGGARGIVVAKFDQKKMTPGYRAKTNCCRFLGSARVEDGYRGTRAQHHSKHCSTFHLQEVMREMWTEQLTIMKKRFAFE